MARPAIPPSRGRRAAPRSTRWRAPCARPARRTPRPQWWRAERALPIRARPSLRANRPSRGPRHSRRATSRPAPRIVPDPAASPRGTSARMVRGPARSVASSEQVRREHRPSVGVERRPGADDAFHQSPAASAEPVSAWKTITRLSRRGIQGAVEMIRLSKVVQDVAGLEVNEGTAMVCRARIAGAHVFLPAPSSAPGRGRAGGRPRPRCRRRAARDRPSRRPPRARRRRAARAWSMRGG